MGKKFSKKYFRKKSKENYESNKKLSKLYQLSNDTESFSLFKKKAKKDKNSSFLN